MFSLRRRRWTNIEAALGQRGVQPSPAHDTSTQCWFNGGPASLMVDQHWTSIGLVYRIFWKPTESAVCETPIMSNKHKTLTQHRDNISCLPGIASVNIALRRFLHNHGKIATEGSPKSRLWPTIFELIQGFFIVQSTVRHYCTLHAFDQFVAFLGNALFIGLHWRATKHINSTTTWAPYINMIIKNGFFHKICNSFYYDLLKISQFNSSSTTKLCTERKA